MLRKPLPVPNEADLAVPAAPAAEAMLVDVVVLTADQELFQSAREAVGERNPVWRARSADEAADLLITGRCGVLVVDMAAVSTRADTLIEQIVEQFPDVVVCVAGTRADEPLLAPLISNGLVYRFMHKPASARRAGMFLQAAIRRHVERREGREASDPLLPLLRGLRQPTAGMPRGYLVLIGLVALALTVPFFVGGEPAAPEATATAAAPAAPAPAAASTGRADPVLSRARAALQAGRLEAPEGRNALDLFQAVLLAQPEHPEAQASLAQDGRPAAARVRSRNSMPATRRKPNGWCSGCSRPCPMSARRRHWLAPSTRPTRRRASCRASSAPRSKRTWRITRSCRQPLPHVRGRSQKSRLSSPRCRDRSRSWLARPVARRSAAPQAPPPVVRPDPLAPRIVNPTRTIAPAARSYAREPVNVLPTAGVTGPTARRESPRTRG